MSRYLYAVHLEIRKEGAEEAKLGMYEAVSGLIGERNILIKRSRMKADRNLEYDYAGFSGMPGQEYAANAMALDIYFSNEEEKVLELDTALLTLIAEKRKQFSGELYAIGVTAYTKNEKTEEDYEPGFRLDHCFAFEDAHACGYEYIGVNEFVEQYGADTVKPLLDEFRS